RRRPAPQGHRVEPAVPARHVPAGGPAGRRRPRLDGAVTPAGAAGPRTAEQTGAPAPEEDRRGGTMLSTEAVAEFEAELGPDAVVTDPVSLRSYECDGLTGFRVVPSLVLLPRSAEQVAACTAVCARHGIPFVARGAGTGLSGGALPVADGVVISLQRLRRVLSVDPDDRRATVEPGVTNADVTRAAAAHGLYFAPDPSSGQVCTVGGNVAENSGGAHCLKYGFTVNHVHAADVVLPDGSLVRLGGDAPHQAGYDLRGAFIGPERTLVADFDSVEQAGDTVTDIIAAGIVPAAIEMVDALAAEAVEEAVAAGYSRTAAAALIVEVDGPEQEVDEQFAEVRRVCRAHG